MSERTCFQGRQATNSVLVFCKASSASSSGRAELLSTQGAIAVDSRYIELGRSGLKANLNLKQENCVPASPLFRQLAARGTRRGLRGTPSARPSRLVLGTVTPAARLPCWGHELGSAVLFNLVYRCEMCDGGASAWYHGLGLNKPSTSDFDAPYNNM